MVDALLAFVVVFGVGLPLQRWRRGMWLWQEYAEFFRELRRYRAERRRG